MGGHELLEHTADVGIRAWGDDLEGAFAEAGRALVELMGCAASSVTGTRRLRVAGDDPGALLVGLLDELIFVCESGDGVRDVAVTRTDGGLEASAEVGPIDPAAEGLEVKAATFHQLAVDERADAVEVRVFVDV